jgi:hypothetical protein
LQDLSNLQRREFQLRNPSGQALTGLLQQHPSCRSQQQKLAAVFTLAAALVNNASQDAENFWYALYLIQDHQLPGVRHKEGFRVIELPLGGR